MNTPVTERISEREQTRWQSLKFFGKAWAFRLRRIVSGPRVRRFGKSFTAAENRVIAESRSLLYTNSAVAEISLQSGKVHNLRVAASYLHGLLIPAGEVFSFWAHVPRPTQWNQFAVGRELREGCIVPSIGGGLCQLSNALYDAALIARCEIVERHAHSRKIPGSMAVIGRDATVFWNYVDLRFRPVNPVALEVYLTPKELIVRLREVTALPEPGASMGTNPLVEEAILEGSYDTAAVESCETCDVTSCFRHIGQSKEECTVAWLVDAYWPEFDSYLSKHRKSSDSLFLPLDSKRYHVGGYFWNTAGFARVRQAPWEVMKRSWISRRLTSQGAERQRALLWMDE
ncbi:MAG: vanw family protein, partial [Chthoniobacteraceae bacterium]|nr:vanw family protein [Chthoniobacteraceae bacterium]